MADKGYVGLGLLTPTKRKPGLKMPKVVKDNNRVINKLRAVVERVIAQLIRLGVCCIRVLGGRWVFMSGCFLLVRGLVFYAAGRTFE